MPELEEQTFDPSLANEEEQDLGESSNEEPEEDTEQAEDEIQSDDETPEDESTEENPDEEGEEPEYYDSEEEYLKQFDGIPEDLKSIDDVIKAYKETLPKVKDAETATQQLQKVDEILKANGVQGGIQAVLSQSQGAPVQNQMTSPLGNQPATGSNPLVEAPFTSALSTYEKRGMFKDEDTKRYYQELAQFSDEAISPFLRTTDQLFKVVAKELMAIKKQTREVSWKTLEHPKKDAVDKNKVFDVMDTYGFDNLDKAIGFLLLQNPEIINKISEKAESKGIKKGQQKLKRFRGIRRSKSMAKESHNYKKYQNPDGSWNQQKLDTLPDMGVSILEDWEKEHIKH